MMTVSVFLLILGLTPAADDSLVERLSNYDAGTIVLGPVRESPLAGMLGRELKAALRGAVQRETEAWNAVRSRDDWEAFRAVRLKKLRESLGEFPEPPPALKSSLTGTIAGDGFFIDKLVIESRPGLAVTINRYRPARPAKSMAGIIICHSHQQPKNTGWRQDMGMTWARAGCVVLVPDLLGHGERRQHPFRGPEDFAQPYLPGRQDYWFRYDVSLQLYTIGDSLMGWFVWDLQRCVDALLAYPGVDANRIALISEPAGGGDVAAVTAALDPRITCVVPTNFGGPQPESPYPLPSDAELSFDFAGNGSWESTRNLYRSAVDGAHHWFIVAAAAPRCLIYNQEFYWDRDNDPAWRRLRKVYDFYGAGERLAGVAGHGFVVGKEPLNTHWIPLNRELLYPYLERWLHIPNPQKEYSRRLPEQDLECLTPDLARDWQLQSAHELSAREAERRLKAARAQREGLRPAEQREQLRRDLTGLLGDVTPRNPVLYRTHEDRIGDVAALKLHLNIEPGIVAPMVLLLPAKTPRPPVVLALAQAGKQAFLQQRTQVIVDLLSRGVAVALPDLRGTGESSPGEARDRSSAATALSATSLMLGAPLLGARLRDVRSLLKHLRTRDDVDATRLALWGDSFVPHIPKERAVNVPHGVPRPDVSEPAGALLAQLAALYEDDVRAIYARGGLVSFQSLLQSPFVHVPHDIIIPGILEVGDVNDLISALAPRPVWLQDLVDGNNRRVYAGHRIQSVADWLADSLRH